MDNVVVFLFWRRRFCRHFAPGLDAHASPICAETKCARYLGASDDGNLSVGISWLTFLLQSSEQRRVQRDILRMIARESYFPRLIFQNPSRVRCSVQSVGRREALRINVLALSCCG
jgi:hypothetical protein